jgi:hypothetical protein
MDSLAEVKEFYQQSKTAISSQRLWAIDKQSKLTLMGVFN